MRERNIVEIKVLFFREINNAERGEADERREGTTDGMHGEF